jgi:hypothetical protein
MKKILLALLLTSSVCYSQTVEKKTLFKSKLGYEIVNSIREKDTMTYFYYGYQNQKYQHITDIGSVFLSKKSDLKLFADKLIEFSEKEKGTDISFADKKFTMILYDFSEMIYIEDTKGKYTTLTKKNAKKLADEIYTKLDLLKD